MESNEVLFDNLSKDNVANYAAVHYHNPHFTNPRQFTRDLRKVSIIKKQMNKFDVTDDTESHDNLARKVTNNVITFINMFGQEPALRILFVLMEKRFWYKMKPIIDLLFDGDIPLSIEGIDGDTVLIEHLSQDEFFASYIWKMEEYQGIMVYRRNDVR